MDFSQGQSQVNRNKPCPVLLNTLYEIKFFNQKNTTSFAASPLACARFNPKIPPATQATYSQALDLVLGAVYG